MINLIYQEKYKELTKLEKETIKNLLQDNQLTMKWSIQKTANELNISTATIHRLTQKMGYNSFPEFKAALIEYYNSKKNNSYEIDFKQDINQTLALLDKKDFTNIIEMIEKSKRIIIAGYGMNNYIAGIMESKLRIMGYNAIHSSNAWYTRLELESYNKDDVVVALSKSASSQEIVSVISDAKKQGVKILLFAEQPNDKTLNMVDAIVIFSKTLSDDKIVDDRLQMHIAITYFLNMLKEK